MGYFHKCSLVQIISSILGYVWMGINDFGGMGKQCLCQWMYKVNQLYSTQFKANQFLGQFFGPIFGIL